MLLLLVSLLCFLAESKFRIEKTYRSYNKISLTCKTDTGSEQNPQWWFNETPLAKSQCYKHTSTGSSNGSISVTVTPECEGEFKCSAQAMEVTDKKITPLRVLAYPVVVNDSIVVVKVKEGSSVTLDCRLEISALNNIEVNWKKNSNCPISSQQILSNYSLELTNVTSSHTGTYVCEGTAKNLRDDNLCTKKTFTHLEVEKFYPVANLTATYYKDTAVFSVLADGSLPITYQLFVEGTPQGKGVSRQEVGSVQLYICINHTFVTNNEVPIVKVVATNVDWSGHTHEATIDVTIRTQQHAKPSDSSYSPYSSKSANLYSESTNLTTTTPEAPHSTTITPEAPHPTTTTLEVPNPTTTTPKAPNSTTTTPKAPHSTTTTPKAPHSTTTTPKAPHSTTPTTEAPNSTTTTTEAPNSTTTTTEAPNSTTLPTEAPHSTPEAPHSTAESPTDYSAAMKLCGVVSGVAISIGIMGVVSGVSISIIGIVGVICLIVSYKKRQPRNSQDAKLEMQVTCNKEEDCKSLSSVGSHSYQCKCSNGTYFMMTSNNEVIFKTSGSISEYSV